MIKVLPSQELSFYPLLEQLHPRKIPVPEEAEVLPAIIELKVRRN